MPEEPMNYPLYMGLLTAGTGIMDYPTRYTRYPRSYTEDVGRAMREGISTWMRMYPSYRKEQQEYALQQQALEEKQQEKQRFNQILGKLREQPLPGMNPAMIDQISMLDPKRGLDTLYNLYSGVKPPAEKYRTLSAQEEEKFLGSNLPGVWQVSPEGQYSQIPHSAPPEVKTTPPAKKDKPWAFSILNQILQSEQQGTEMPPQHQIDTAAAILRQGYADPQTGNWVVPHLPDALSRNMSGTRKAARTTFAGQGLVTPRQGQGISHVLTGAGIEYNQDNVKQFLTDNGTVFNPNGSIKTYGPKFDPPQGKMQFPDNMPGLKMDMPYNVGALGEEQVKQMNREDADRDAQEAQKFNKETFTPREIAQLKREEKDREEAQRRTKVSSKVKGKAIEQVETNHNLMKTLYKMARIVGGATFADTLIQRPDAQGNMESLVQEGFKETAIKELLEAGVSEDDEDVGFEIFGETAGALSMLHSDTFNMIRKAYDFGAPQQAEFEFFEQMLTNPTHLESWWSPKQMGGGRPKFRGQLRMMFQQANARAKTWELLSKSSGLDPELIKNLRSMRAKGVDEILAIDESPIQSRDDYRNDNPIDD